MGWTIEKLYVSYENATHLNSFHFSFEEIVSISTYFRLPAWTESVFFPGSDMENLANFCFSMPTNSKLLARLKVGFLIRDILERFTQKIESTLVPDRSLWIYSGHDTTISNLLNALGLFEVCLLMECLAFIDFSMPFIFASISASYSNLCIVLVFWTSWVWRWFLCKDFLQAISRRR